MFRNLDFPWLSSYLTHVESSKGVFVRTLKMTSKRQVTLPVQICEELGVEAGDTLLLERAQMEGRQAWLLRPRRERKERWAGSLRKYAVGKSHDMRDVRASIARATRDQRR